MNKQNVYIFGSFNPIHVGHMSNIKNIFEKYGNVVVVPSPNNPDKDPKDLLPFSLRCQLITYATIDLGVKVDINTIESTIDKPNYSYKTFRQLKEQEGVDELILAYGTDILIDLPKWKNYDKVLNNKFIHIHRKGYDPSKIPSEVKSKIIGDIDHMYELSSTEIREMIEKRGFDDTFCFKYKLSPSVIEALKVWYGEK